MRYRGDINKDNIIGTLDATYILSYLNGDLGTLPEANATLDSEQILRANVDSDSNNISSDDVVYLLSYLAGKSGYTYKRVDTTQPKILILGDSQYYYWTQPEGNQFIDPGYQAIDNYDGDITHQVQTNVVDEIGNVMENVDITQEGIYTITYTIVDEAGNSTSIQRVINVTDSPEPEPEPEP